MVGAQLGMREGLERRWMHWESRKVSGWWGGSLQKVSEVKLAAGREPVQHQRRAVDRAD